MSTLHTVNKSPAEGLIQECLKLTSPGDALLLIEDGVYCIQLAETLFSKKEIKVYCLRDDLVARGLHDKKLSEIETVNMSDFVDLCVSHNRCMNWF
ncbi:MAG: sulfurtransferase complex subunit TusB [Pseudohongiellaceae bacterium]